MNKQRIIEQTLSDYPATRNSDMELVIRVWEMQGLELTPKQLAFFKEKAIPAETIGRARRKLQEHGQYLASEEVDKARFEKFVQIKDGIARIGYREVADIL